MKKILAIILALTMVCTMAFAVDILSPGSTPVVTPGATYDVVRPGGAIDIPLSELKTLTGLTEYTDNGVFVPEKNPVSVTFAKGEDLVAKRGWVQRSGVWYYELALKDSTTAEANTAVCNIGISKITYTPYGRVAAVAYSTPTGKTFAEQKVSDAHCGCTVVSTPTNVNEVTTPHTTAAECNNWVSAAYEPLAWAYGWDVATVYIDASTYNSDTLAGVIDANSFVNGNIYKIMASNTKNSGTNDYVRSAMLSLTVPADTKIDAKVNAGDKIVCDTFAFVNADAEAAYNKLLVGASVRTVYDGTKVINTKANICAMKVNDVYKYAYMVNENGTLSALNFNIKDGVMYISANSIGYVIVTDKALSATSAPSNGTTSSTDGTKNPNTGANDIVGVAAAISVIALISGAAISLKK